MQVRRVLKFLAELKGVKGSEADRRIDEWLERLSLKTPEKDWGLAKIDELSRGMQQKVQFIGTLLHDPDLVILDEPFSGLDPINAQALKDTVVELRKRGKTVIFVALDGRPKMWFAAASGAIMVRIILMVVVFPAPLGPSSPYTLPAGTRSVRSRTAVCSAKRLVTFTMSIAYSVM
jgi:ABC-type nitrate/sulfonate/bicarbonate transport system ATPase subunit